MPPKSLGPYKIIQKLGQGGMGSVYEAIHQETGQIAAVKTLASFLGGRAGFRERFKTEIETLRKLDHPNIVRIYGWGEADDETLFYSMELVRGTSLEDELQAGRRFFWREAIDIAIQTCKALRHAHDRGIIHRDIKPANLMITPEAQVKLSDFGIAKLYGNTGMTLDGGPIGTANYMSPEQTEGGKATERSDLYSLGCTLYALLTGRPPFVASSLPEVLNMQRYARPEPVVRHTREVPPSLDAVIMRMLEKDPDARPARAGILQRSLEMVVRSEALRSGEIAPDADDVADGDSGDAPSSEPPTPGTFAPVAPPASSSAPNAPKAALDRTVHVPETHAPGATAPELPAPAPNGRGFTVSPGESAAPHTLAGSQAGSLSEADATMASNVPRGTAPPDQRSRADVPPTHRVSTGAFDETLDSHGAAVSRVRKPGPTVASNTAPPVQARSQAGPYEVTKASEAPVNRASVGAVKGTHGQPGTYGQAARKGTLGELPPQAGPEGGSAPGNASAGNAASPDGDIELAEQPQAAPSPRFVTVDEARLQEEQQAREAEEAQHRTQRKFLIRMGIYAGILLAMVFIGLWLMVWYYRNPDTMYSRIKAIVEKTGPEDAETDIRDFSRWYPDDVRSKEMKEWMEEIELKSLERQAAVRAKRLLQSQTSSAIERAYLEAIAYAQIDPERGVAKLEAIIQIYSVGGGLSDDERNYLKLAGRQRDRLNKQIEKTAIPQLNMIRQKMDRAEKSVETDPEMSRRLALAVLELYEGKPWAASQVKRAKETLATLPPPPATQPSTQPR